VKGGMAYGATDDFGFASVETARTPARSYTRRFFTLMGLDHKRLTYRQSGRDFRLTDVAGNVVRDILV
jgi:hypothetical protein